MSLMMTTWLTEICGILVYALTNFIIHMCTCWCHCCMSD